MLSAVSFSQPEKQLLIYSIPFGRLGAFVRLAQFLKQSSIFVHILNVLWKHRSVCNADTIFKAVFHIGNMLGNSGYLEQTGAA